MGQDRTFAAVAGGKVRMAIWLLGSIGECEGRDVVMDMTDVFPRRQKGFLIIQALSLLT
jgi:hypothetical protein